MSVDLKSQLAVALHYDKTGAPRVVAKGKGSIGARIVEVAKAHDIPIEENEVLAGALSHVEIGDEIPAELYKAVAEVLVFVLRLSGRVRYRYRPVATCPTRLQAAGAGPKKPTIFTSRPSGRFRQSRSKYPPPFRRP